MSTPVLLGMPSLPPTSPRGVGNLRGEEKFPTAAHRTLADGQLRRNLAHATSTIRAKRAAVVGEVADWEELREAGRQLKVTTMANLPAYLTYIEPVLGASAIAALLLHLPLNRRRSALVIGTTIFTLHAGPLFSPLLNPLYAPEPAWLAILSYAQFTFEALALATIVAVIWTGRSSPNPPSYRERS